MTDLAHTPVVAITRAIPGAVEVPGAEVRVLGDGLPTRADVLSFVRGASAVVSMFTDRVDAEFLDAAGPGLRGVANYAVGHDNIDLDECGRRGVAVSLTPDAVTEGTSNMAWLLIMACARRLIEADRYARSPEYPARGGLGMGDFLGMDLREKNLLIVGAGRIGHALAMKSRAWDMRVGYVARSNKPAFESEPLCAQKHELLEGLAWADVVSVHLPLTDQTRGLLGAEAFGVIKPGAIVVNTGRGDVLSSEALVGALESGRVWGAGLDVHEGEPVIHPGLLGRSDVVLTPHIGSAEIRYREAMTAMVSANVRAMLAGEPVPHPA